MKGKKKLIIALCSIIAVCALIVFASMSLSNNGTKADVVNADIQAFNKLIDASKEDELYADVRLDQKIVYKNKETDGTLAQVVNKASGTKVTYVPIDPATFIETETGSLSSAYTTGYIGTITIPDANVYGASLYRSSDPTYIDVNIYATEVLDWSGIIGVEGSPAVIAGHNNIGVFGGFGGLSAGSQIYFDLGYGEFIYEVTGFAVGDAADGNIYFNGTDVISYGQGGGSQLIFYTCYPLNAYPATQRYIVYCSLVDGTELS